MDEHHPRRGLLDLPHDVHTIISGLVDATSRLSFVSCSKKARLLWMHTVFKKIRLEGTQTDLVDDLTLYLADRSTLVDHLRHGLKSLTIVIHATPMYKKSDPVTWGNLLDLPRKHRFVEFALPDLIWKAIRLPLNLDVLALNLTDFNRFFQRMMFTEHIYSWEGFPKVKHLRVVGPPMLASTVISVDEERVRIFALAIEGFPTLKRIAFAVPDAQIGNSIIRDIDDGSNPRATPAERNIWFHELVRSFMKMAPQLEEACVITRHNMFIHGTRKASGISIKTIKTSAEYRPDVFPLALIR
ncbi:hypothetical protein NCS52_00470500 [Fusarium sp. LHS14.1]|nr:hypothetical protein NCS52_00470500 [Fusarium sp. LHS14.1]